MAISRTIKCAVCNISYTEEKEGIGFPGWGQLNGIVFNGEANPHLCPNHLGVVADFLDEVIKNDLD